MKVIFLEVRDSLHWFWRKCLLKCPRLTIYSLSVNHSFKQKLYSMKKKAVSLARSQSHKPSLSSSCSLLHSRSPFCIFILSQGIFLKQFKGQELINNFSTVKKKHFYWNWNLGIPLCSVICRIEKDCHLVAYVVSQSVFLWIQHWKVIRIREYETQIHLDIDMLLAMIVYYLNPVINKHFPSENLTVFTLKYFFKKVKQ